MSKTVMIPLTVDTWVNLGIGPMALASSGGHCIFATGDEAPTYSIHAGLPIPPNETVFVNTSLPVWGRLYPGALTGELVVAPMGVTSDMPSERESGSPKVSISVTKSKTVK